MSMLNLQSCQHRLIYRPDCNGRGWVKTIATVTAEVQRALRREAPHRPGGALVVCADADVIAALEEDGFARLDAVEAATGRRIELRAEPGWARDGFDILVD